MERFLAIASIAVMVAAFVVVARWVLKPEPVDEWDDDNGLDELFPAAPQPPSKEQAYYDRKFQQIVSGRPAPRPRRWDR